jgi:hypothetical protein
VSSLSSPPEDSEDENEDEEGEREDDFFVAPGVYGLHLRQHREEQQEGTIVIVAAISSVPVLADILLASLFLEGPAKH